jgi:hypothetical protein
MALSFTEAIPWMTSRRRDIIAGLHQDASPHFKALAGTTEDGALRYSPPDSGLSFAFISRRELRSDSACAFPRPPWLRQSSQEHVNQSQRYGEETGASPFRTAPEE